jgi:TolB protein
MPLLQGQQNRFDTEISGRTQEKVSLHLTGFSGEIREVLEFDLYLGGFQLVDAGKGRYELSGNTETDVRGTLKDSQGHVLFDRIYPGGTRRTQAHTLANDVIQLGTGSAPSFTNQKIIYRMDGNVRNQWNELVSEIYASDYDGANPVQLTHDGSVVRSPAWKPGERTIYYTSFLNGAPHVYSHDLTTGARRPYAAFGGLNDGTAFSWDGQRVAMILSRAGSPDLWVASAVGTNWKRLTQAREEESSPCWSPDGRQICFSSGRNGAVQLYTISPEGGEPKPLNTGGIRGATEPDWSPDGRWIAFTRMGRGQNFQIYVVPSEGGNPKKVADGEDPSWGPNSRLLLFVRRTKEGNRRLSLLDVPTGHVKDSLPVQGSCSQPSWAR